MEVYKFMDKAMDLNSHNLIKFSLSKKTFRRTTLRKVRFLITNPYLKILVPVDESKFPKDLPFIRKKV